MADKLTFSQWSNAIFAAYRPAVIRIESMQVNGTTTAAAAYYPANGHTIVGRWGKHGNIASEETTGGS